MPSWHSLMSDEHTRSYHSKGKPNFQLLAQGWATSITDTGLRQRVPRETISTLAAVATDSVVAALVGVAGVVQTLVLICNREDQ